MKINGKEVKVRPAVDDAEWQNIRLGLRGVWTRNANLGARRLRDYVGTGSDIERVIRVIHYLRQPLFVESGLGNEHTEALLKFCERKYRKAHESAGTFTGGMVSRRV